MGWNVNEVLEEFVGKGELNSIERMGWWDSVGINGVVVRLCRERSDVNG